MAEWASGGRFAEVEEVTSEFLQTYKIHISVHVSGAVSTQAGGKQWARGSLPTGCPASRQRGGGSDLPPVDLGICLAKGLVLGAEHALPGGRTNASTHLGC